MRNARITRKTAETDISVDLDIDGTGQSDCQTGIGFFDHMLDQLARHSLIDLTVRQKLQLYNLYDFHSSSLPSTVLFICL